MHNQADSEDMNYASGLYETEAQRLQREADAFTQKLEHEKKRFLIINDQYQQSKREMHALKAKIEQHVMPSEEDTRKQNMQRRKKLHELEHSKHQYNDTVGTNNQLKIEINIMRKEIQFAKKSIEKMESRIEYLKDNIRKHSAESINNFRIADEINNQILSLKCKAEGEKEKFEGQIKQLQERLKEKNNIQELGDDTLEMAKKNDVVGDDFANPIEILQIKVRRVTAVNREKKRLVDQYVRNAQIIEQAFDQIKENSGMSDIDEIVTTFIKAEEQNYSLYNYVNMLNSETDGLEDHIRSLEDQINTYKLLQEQNEARRERMLEDQRQKLEEIKKDISQSQEECENIQNEFAMIAGDVQRMVKLFQRARFHSNVSTKQQYDNDTAFNENNITNYLAELEEYIAFLITMVAHQKEDPNAPISVIDLDHLTEKLYSKKEIQIDPPYTIEKGSAQDFVGGTTAKTDAGDDAFSTTEDEMIFDSKKLYKNFLDLVENQNLKIVPQSHAKREGMASQMNKDDM